MSAPKTTSYKSRYTGTYMHSSWVIKVRASLDGIVPLDTASRAMFLDKEYVTSMLELADGHMLVGVFNLALLVFESYEVLHRIDDADQSNIEKYFMTRFPDFDSEQFPFVLVAGRSQINLVNVRTGYL